MNKYDKHIKQVFRLVVMMFVAVIFFMTVSCRTTSKKSLEANSLYELGMSHLVTGDIQSAFVKFNEVLIIKPKHVKALNGLGYVYMSLSDIKKAEESFRKAVKVDNSFAEASNNLCYVLYAQNMIDEAIAACNKALENPLYATPEKAYYNLGRSYHKKGNYARAIKSFENAIRRNRSFIPGYFAQALSYNANKQYGKAAETMNLAVGLDSRFQGDKLLAEGKFKELKSKGIMDPKEADQYLEMLHY